jgi:EAL domain-containing protein (putative c-di-GMP-specific phosphodiesterase class I)
MAVYYDAEMSLEAEAHFALAADLVHAIPNNEISVEYQPQIDSMTGVLLGAECLARWRHPHKGQISPGQFIPIAERSGVIQELTDFVLERIGVELSGSLGDRVIACNVSERDLRDERLTDRLGAFFDRFSISPAQLEVELTENIVFSNVQRAREQIADLKTLGVRIAVDDFGAGFATLRQLAEFPIDVVKIDRSLIRGIETSPSREAVVAGICEIAARLGLQIIAEGVETPQELAVLKPLGCPVVQGWLYSRSLPANTFRELLAEGMILAERERATPIDTPGRPMR